MTTTFAVVLTAVEWEALLAHLEAVERDGGANVADLVVRVQRAEAERDRLAAEVTRLMQERDELQGRIANALL